jgi:hypothetical protein
MRALFYGLLVFGVVAIGGLWTALNTLKLPPEQRPIETSFVCDIEVADGECGFDTAMARLKVEEERVLVTYDDLPPVLVQAVLAAEDRKFFDHNGVDPVGITRAIYQDLLGSSESQQGGSTITQQYVKNVYLTSERTFDRKLREAVLAIVFSSTVRRSTSFLTRRSSAASWMPATIFSARPVKSSTIFRSSARNSFSRSRSRWAKSSSSRANFSATAARSSSSATVVWRCSSYCSFNRRRYSAASALAVSTFRAARSVMPAGRPNRRAISIPDEEPASPVSRR